MAGKRPAAEVPPDETPGPPERLGVPTAHDYDAWYRSSRGAWIGETECRLLLRQLRPETGANLLDVGCGTGYFTRQLARQCRSGAVGLDPNPCWIQFARAHRAGGERYCRGPAESLPFADRSFDCTVSVTALCFVPDVRRALREILRVTRRRFAIGMLNRHSLLYPEKGRHGGLGAYRGAQWHTASELRALFERLPAANLALRGAVFLPGGGALARRAERILPQRLLLGAFLAVAGDVCAVERPGIRHEPVASAGPVG
jgi:SAM-dependent methyltransferase